MTVDRDDISRIRVLVDASRVPRCQWCGTTQSDEWKTNQSGAFCSDNCQKVAAYERVWPLYCLIGLNAILWLFLTIVVPSWQKLTMASIGILGTILSLICSFVDMPPRDYKEKVPKNSRSSTGTLDNSLLKTVATHIECPNCDGNIDLSKVKEDMVYHCDYCGADGIVEIVKMKQ